MPLWEGEKVKWLTLTLLPLPAAGRVRKLPERETRLVRALCKMVWRWPEKKSLVYKGSEPPA